MPLMDTLAGLGSMEFHELAPFNQGSVGVFWCGAGTSPWERHPDDDELLGGFDDEPAEAEAAGASAAAASEDERGRSHVGEDFERLLSAPGEHVLMFKLTYRWATG